MRFEGSKLHNFGIIGKVSMWGIRKNEPKVFLLLLLLLMGGFNGWDKMCQNHFWPFEKWFGKEKHVWLKIWC
jgi:hypothetical protein